MKRESGGHARPREAQLLAAASHLYPGIPAGVWIQAATMTDMVLAQRLRRGSFSLMSRALDPAHFEFRSVGGQAPSDSSLRRRATDRPR